MLLPSITLPSVASAIENIIAPRTFANKGTNNDQGLLYFIILIFLIMLTMWIGAFIFNASVVKIFPSVKKVSTVDFFGLYIVIHLLFC